MTSDAFDDAPRFLSIIAALYSYQVGQHGAEPKSVFWRNLEGQILRFEVMVDLIGPEFNTGGVTINDLGCGYGAFFDFIKDMPFMKNGRFFGYDISREMIELAGQRINDPRAFFEQSMLATARTDFSFASGTFNMKDLVDDATWVRYVKDSLEHLWSVSGQGMAFNMLSTREHRADDTLYYADVDEFAAFCREKLSPDVTVITDYPLEEWTIFVRRTSQSSA